MNEDSRYFARSWALLTHDKGWIKPVLVLCAAFLVPIAGPLGVLGYSLEWARLTAWGVDSSPKQKGVDVGACIKTGAMAFVVSLVYMVVYGLAARILGALPIFGSLFDLMGPVLSCVMSVLVLVASLRMAIYQEIGAGFGIEQIFSMIRRKPEGFLRVLGMQALISTVLAIVLAIPWAAAVVAEVVRPDVMPYVQALGEDVGDAYTYQVIAALVFDFLARNVPLIALTVIVTTVVSIFSRLMTATACGLWFRNFDVASWGRSSDPLPPDQPLQPAYPQLPPSGGVGWYGPDQAGGQAYGQPGAYQQDSSGYGVPGVGGYPQPTGYEAGQAEPYETPGVPGPARPASQGQPSGDAQDLAPGHPGVAWTDVHGYPVAGAPGNDQPQPSGDARAEQAAPLGDPGIQDQPGGYDWASAGMQAGVGTWVPEVGQTDVLDQPAVPSHDEDDDTLWQVGGWASRDDVPRERTDTQGIPQPDVEADAHTDAQEAVGAGMFGHEQARSSQDGTADVVGGGGPASEGKSAPDAEDPGQVGGEELS